MRPAHFGALYFCALPQASARTARTGHPVRRTGEVLTALVSPNDHHRAHQGVSVQLPHVQPPVGGQALQAALLVEDHDQRGQVTAGDGVGLDVAAHRLLKRSQSVGHLGQFRLAAGFDFNGLHFVLPPV